MKPLLDAVVVDAGAALARPGGTELRAGVLDDLAWLGRTVRLGAILDSAAIDEALVPASPDRTVEGAVVDVVVTSLEAGVAKPDPKALLLALDRLGLTDPSRVLVLGSGPLDESAAAAAGMAFADMATAPSAGRSGLRDVVEAWIERNAGGRFEAARASVAQSGAGAANDAAALHARLAKSPGSLGRVEAVGVKLAGIADACPPPIPEPATLAVFAADHGIVEWGVSPWPQEATAAMVANLVHGGAAVNVFARHAGVDVIVVDVGVTTPLRIEDGDVVLDRSVRNATDNLAKGPAMSRTDALLALDVGAEVAQRAVESGARCLVTGDVGVGSTTAATAIIAAITNRSAHEITSRGSGADDEMLARKIQVVEAVNNCLAAAAGPLTLLEQAGGLEIAALVGFIVAGAAARVPVVVDGVVADAAMLVAVQFAPDVIDYVIAGQRSTEPAAAAALEFAGLDPLVELGLSHGEGSGAVLSLSIVQASAKILREMATLDGAGLTRD